MKLHENSVALIVGSFLGLWHLLWSILVAIGLAQPLIDFIYWLHFLNNPFRVATFNVTTAFLLVVVTFVIGYAGGWAFAWLWNTLHKK